MSQVVETSERPPLVQVGFDAPHRQHRATVAFRLILMIPHFIVVIVFELLLSLVVLISWFAALFTGRVPEGAASFIARTIQYVTRVYAYGYVLTDLYPPFGLSTREYPLTVEIPQTRLNRLAVLFRLILMIPTYVLVALVGAGINVVIVFAWLIVLVAGTMPASLYQALAAVLRYQTRFAAYTSLATAAYPSGLFGDKAAPAIVETAAIETPDEPEPPAETLAAPAEMLAPPASTPVSTPLATTLRLTTGAKRLVALFLILGAAWIAGGVAYAAVLGPRVDAFAQLLGPYDRVSLATQKFQNASVACRSSGGIDCEKDAIRDVTASLDAFARDVRGIDFPADARADADRLVADTNALSQVLKQALTATTGPEFSGFLQRVPELGAQFDDDFQTLQDDLT